MNKEVIDAKIFIDSMFTLKQQEDYLAGERLVNIGKWENLINKTLQKKFYLSFNCPVLLLGLFLWAGIFGGIWFAYKDRFLFGTFIWPLITIVVTFLMILGLELPIFWGFTDKKWLIVSVTAGQLIAQFILALIANYIYLNGFVKNINAGKQKMSQANGKKCIASFAILLFIITPVMIMLLNWPSFPPALFWG